MTIYKTIRQILKKNIGSLAIGAIIMIVLIPFFNFQIKTVDDSMEKVKIAVVSKDNALLAKGLSDYLGKQHTLVSLQETSQKYRDDALAFGKVEYILDVPADFSRELTAGQAVSLESQGKPGTFSKTLVDETVNNFINTFLTYQKALPQANEAEILAKTQATLAKKGTRHFDSTYAKKQSQIAKGRLYNMLAYGLFATLFGGYAVVNLAFNKEEIRRRNSCSPLSKRQFSRKITTGNLVYAMICTVAFLLFIMVNTGASFDALTGYFVLNTCIFFTAMIGFSSLATRLMRSSEEISGVLNVAVLGSCFIGGVFVPTEMLPSIVTKVAAFTPTYWFAKNNQLIGGTMVFDQRFFQKFAFQAVIILVFAAVFFMVQMVFAREKGKKMLG